MDRARRLRAGDRVAIVAPAGPAPSDLLVRGAEVLRSWGLRVDPVPDRTDPRLPYLAGTDTERAEEFTRAWCDPEIRAVFCARGGYGTTRMLAHLDRDRITTAEPTILIGSSDITALHQALLDWTGIPSLFGPMPASSAFLDEPDNAERLHRMLFEPDAATRDLAGPAATGLVPGTAEGVLVGGNLSLLAATSGDPMTPLPPPGAIGLLEDVGEAAYRLDRSLTQLRATGWLSRLSGIALGSWQDCGPDPDAVAATLLDRVGDLGIPVASEVGFGHGPEQRTVPLGVRALLSSEPGSGRAALTPTEAFLV